MGGCGCGIRSPLLIEGRRMKQYKAAILGSENFHAKGIARDLLEGYMPNVTLVGAYGTEEKANQYMREMGVELVTDDPTAFTDDADILFITSRHGDSHLPLARPYMTKGRIIWVDKPLAIQPAYFEALMEEAEQSGALLWGSSFLGKAEAFAPLIQAVKHPETLGRLCGGTIATPVRRDPEYGGFFFYTQHLVEIAIAIFGSDIKSVFATESANGYTVILRYENFDIPATYREGSFHYDACACFEQGSVTGHVTPDDVSTMHRLIFEEVEYAMRHQTAYLTRAQMALPFHILHKLHDSLLSGRFEEIK